MRRNSIYIIFTLISLSLPFMQSISCVCDQVTKFGPIACLTDLQVFSYVFAPDLFTKGIVNYSPDSPKRAATVALG